MPRPPKDPQSRLDKLIEQENQLKNKIQLAKNRLQTEISKERSARLFAWGVVIEEQLKSSALAPKTWRNACLSCLKDYCLQKVLTEPLANVKIDSLESDALPSPQPRQILDSDTDAKLIRLNLSKSPMLKVRNS